MDLEDVAGLQNLFAAERFDRVVNLAARAHPVEHLVYASSSSVYGIDKLMPFGEIGSMCERRTRSVVATSTGAADHPASPGRMTVQVP